MECDGSHFNLPCIPVLSLAFMIKTQSVAEFGDLTLTLNPKGGQETQTRPTSQDGFKDGPVP